MVIVVDIYVFGAKFYNLACVFVCACLFINGAMNKQTFIIIK